ncbi:MAG: DinB family protein [Gelidibacter sp.]|nr:DinB family protein [Gelidibacter sp.]
MNIHKSILDLEKAIPFYEQHQKLVSAKNVAWHLDHSLKVINSVCEELKISKPENYKSTFSMLKFYIFFRGRIPRGKAKAPKSVVSNEEILKSSIESQLALAKMNLLEIKNLPPKSNFDHPYFGKLSLKKSQHFLAIHTNHHLTIVNDILAN